MRAIYVMLKENRSFRFRYSSSISVCTCILEKNSPLHYKTYLLGGSNDAIIDVVFNKADAFAPLNHDYASLFKGQASILVVNGPDGQPGNIRS